MPWHAWGCMAIAMALPINKKLVPGFIVLLSIYVIVYFIRRRRLHQPSRKLPLLVITGIFVLHLIGLFYSEHSDAAINEIGIKLSLIVFPILAWLMPPLNNKQTKNILMSFVYGCLIFIPLAIGFGIYRAIHYHEIAYLSYEKLGIYFHPTYAATYQAMGFFILMYYASQRIYLFGKEKIHYVVCGIMLIFISMLASKAGLIATMISIVMSSWLFYSRKKSWSQALVVCLISVAVLIFSTVLAPETSTRVEAAIVDFEDDTTFQNTEAINNTLHNVVSPSDSAAEKVAEAKSSTQLRLVTWSAAKDVLFENPLGTGTGDTKYALIEKYIERGENYAAEKKLNAHNQFLQYGAEFGWPGLFLITLCIVSLIYIGFKQGEIVLLNFALLCAMNFLFESFLEVQAGIVFFCFWIMVFFVTRKSKHNKLST